MNVEERKQKARLLEQQGEFADALEHYETALTELEGTPGIWRELPLYVKAGDLSLKMGNASGAISHYERAARAYAAYGSSKSVIALCTKILRVNPEHTHAFLRLVRLMIERDHLAEARLVLLEYAERMKLPKAGVVLEDMADRGNEELKPLLELLLELGGRYEYARAQGRDESASTVMLEAEPAPAESTAASDSDDTRADEVEAAPTEQQVLGGLTQQTDEDESEQAQVEPAFQGPFDAEGGPGFQDRVVEEESEHGSVEMDAAATEPISTEDDVQWVDDGHSPSMPMPRASRKVLFREGEYRKNKPMALWIGLGVAAVIVVGGLSLLLFGVVSLGGDDASTVPPVALPAGDATDSAQVDEGALADSLGPAGRRSAAAADTSSASEGQVEEAVAQLGTQTTVEDSASADVPEPDAASGAAAADSVPTVPSALIDDPPAEQAEPDMPTGRGVMVQDFVIESSTEFEMDGRAGFGVIQILGTGEQLTLNAVYYGEDIGSAPGSEEMTLTPLVGDTTTAIIQFGGYAVEARAVVSPSVLQTLLGRLVEVPPSS